MKADRLLSILMDMKSFPEELRNEQALAAFRKELAKELQEIKYPNKSIIVSEGEIADRAYMVLEGLVRAFVIDPKSGEEITLFFFKENMAAIAAPSFFAQEPSNVYMEVMPGSVLQHTTLSQATKIFSRIPKAETFVLAVMLDYHNTLVRRLVHRQTLSATERYANLLKEFPDIRKQVIQKVIASYLGITRPTLNKIIREYNS